MSKYRSNNNKDIHQLPSWDVNDNYDDNDYDENDYENEDDNDNGSFDVQSYEDIDDDDFIAKLEKEIGRNNIDSSSTYNVSPDYTSKNNNKSDNNKKNKNPLPSTSRFTAFSNTTSTINTDNNNTKSSNNNNNNKYEDQVLKRYMLKYLDGCFNKIKSLEILLKNMEELIAQKGELTETDVTSFNYDLVRSFKTNTDSIYDKILTEKLLPSKVIKAINLVNRSHSDLQKTMQSILTTLCECMKHQKVTYTRQFKKVRDIANDSIRNSLLMERTKELDNISKLTMKLEEDKIIACQKLQENLDNVKVLNEVLQNEIDSLRQQLVKVQSSITLYASEHSKQAALELQKQKALFEEEKQLLLKEAEDELERQKLEFANLLKAKVKSFEKTIELQRHQEIEVREVIKHQQLKQEEECFQLREQLIKVVAALNVEKERNNERLNEARAQAVKELDDYKADNLKEKALMRVELTKSILKVRDEEKQDKELLAQAIVQNDQKHFDHIERLRAKIELENKALIEKMEIDYIEEIGRMRYHHHQEVDKLNKRIERLSSLLSQAGVPVIDNHLIE